MLNQAWIVARCILPRLVRGTAFVQRLAYLDEGCMTVEDPSQAWEVVQLNKPRTLNRLPALDSGTQADG